MKIEYLGHSSFLLTGNEKSVVTDPFCDIGYDIERVKADYCTVSHGHFDHNYTMGVEALRVVEKQEKGFRAVDAAHDEKEGALRGRVRIFVFDIDGIVFCHLGDTGEKYSEKLKEAIGKVDILFVPVGGRYTIDGDEAAKFVNGIKPAIAIPMHYKREGVNLDIEDEKRFLSHFPNAEYAGKEITLTKSDIVGETRILVMEDKNG
ncbi:MAG: MBL fold metallo-hydrolase [Clostridia bacterium]|nr:MBL fold metallo-hydrolase [Clostridia bacterium]